MRIKTKRKKDKKRSKREGEYRVQGSVGEPRVQSIEYRTQYAEKGTEYRVQSTAVRENTEYRVSRYGRGTAVKYRVRVQSTSELVQPSYSRENRI